MNFYSPLFAFNALTCNNIIKIYFSMFYFIAPIYSGRYVHSKLGIKRMERGLIVVFLNT